MQLKLEHAVNAYKIVEKICVPLSLAVLVWALLNLMSLNDRMAKLEAGGEVDAAQWRLLQSHVEQLKQQAVEVEVYKRLFAMLLDKDKLTIDRVTLPAPSTAPRKSVDDFKAEQIQQMQRAGK